MAVFGGVVWIVATAPSVAADSRASAIEVVVVRASTVEGTASVAARLVVRTDSPTPEPTNPTAPTPAMVAKAVAAIQAEINPNFFTTFTLPPRMTMGSKRTVKRLISGLSTLGDGRLRLYGSVVAGILIIEDDLHVRGAMARALAGRGHDVTTEASGMAGLEASIASEPDVVILDLGLPDVDGLEVLKMIRAVREIPIIVATARDDEREVVKLLDAGADDYVIKPFSAELLEARIRAVLRRAEPATESVRFDAGSLSVDVGAREAALDGEPLDLTRREFDLLAYLIERAGTVVSKREMLADIWRQPYGGADKTVDVHLSWLRRKLGESAKEPRYLHTVRGVGIKLVPPDS